MIQIVKYTNSHQVGIDDMLNKIAMEFEKRIFCEKTSKTQLIPDLFWVALIDARVVGTIGLSIINGFAILKGMFLAKEARGSHLGFSQMMLDKALNYCIKTEISQLYLGTMSQFKAAQHFYIKNGFQPILKNELPQGFKLNPLDDVFFNKKLTTNIILK